MTFTFLGTGTSVGIPQIGCRCATCTSTDPRDKRRRCGAYVRSGDDAVLIDTPPEMRMACVELGIDKVDAVALTHAHMDHVAGFDDIRRFNTINGRWVECDANSEGSGGRTMRCLGKVMPCYASAETEAKMHAIFPYITDKGGAHGLYRPMIEFRNEDEFHVGSIAFTRLAVEHGFPCCGYLIGGKIAYMSDCHELPEKTLEAVKGVEVLIINCLRERGHPTHLSVGAMLEYVEEISPKAAYITHMCHDFTHSQWIEKLSGTPISPAYDGLEVKV